MGNLLGAYLFPHPPIILEEIGMGEEVKAKKTIEGVKILSRDIKEKSPSTIIIITPHGPLFRDAIAISVEDSLNGNFSKFGHSELTFSFKNDLKLIKGIIKNSSNTKIKIVEVGSDSSRIYNIDNQLDHGALVPLYFVNKEYSDYKLIHITYGILPPEDLYRFGQQIERSINESDEDVIIIASGDLSHKLSNDGPYSYSPQGKVFDEKVVNIMKDGKMDDIVSFDLELAESAGECGLRSLMIMAGVLDDYKLETKVLSYEGPFGVGYSTAKIEPVGKKDAFHEMEVGNKKVDSEINKEEHYNNKHESDYVKLARNSLEYYIKNGERLPAPKQTQSLKRGVFVSLKKHNMLRGCIGTIQPTKDSIELEIIENAILAGTQDPRFPNVKEAELDDLVYSVDVLSDPEPISSIDQLDVNRYGVIVSSGFRRGLLLPNLEGVDTVEEQVSIALSKANIRPDEKYKMERFEVIRYY